MRWIRKRDVGAYWLLAAAFLFLIDSSCAKRILIPEGDQRKLDRSRDETYRLVTKAGLICKFKDFTATDSTLVIQSVVEYGDNPSVYDASKIKTPIVIPWTEIESLERISYNNPMTVLAIMVGVAAAAGIIFFVALGVSLASMPSWN